MFSMVCDIVNSMVKFFSNFSNMIGLDALFFIALAVEVFIVIFFLVKSLYSYEASLNRALEKLNYWLFEKKNVTEENIKDLNLLFKMRAPKRLCYYWQQYILFREGAPSTYLSTENLVEKPLKTSSYNSNIKNLTLFSGLWAAVIALFVLIVKSFNASTVTGEALASAIIIPIFVVLISVIFIVFLRARKNAILNSLYQNVQLFGRFMDNACVDLPSYIDYQILFTPQEIENGQPVLREFLDYKARKEKEEFNKAREDDYKHETFDFSATGVDGSIVLDRAMKESELYLKKKEKILLNISQLESELDSRRKNFDNVQKDYQTKIQASKENVDRLRQMQEETTNRIESNYYRKQQTQEIGKQEQFEQEFEQMRAKYLLEKNEGEEEIGKLNAQLEVYKNDVENAMLSEYQTFFDKFCHSAEMVVAKAFAEKMNALKEENEKSQQRITELEIKLKNIPQGQLDASGIEENSQPEGHYDENGNYVYANGTFYDKDGNFHDEKGDVYTQDGTLISKAEIPVVKEEKQIVDFDDFDAFDFMTDTSQKGNIYDVAENVIKSVDDGEIQVINKTEKPDIVPFDLTNDETDEKLQFQNVPQMNETVSFADEDLSFDELIEENKPVQEPVEEVKPVVQENATAKRRGRPKKAESSTSATKTVSGIQKRPGRPKKIIKDDIPVSGTEKRGRGRPRKETSSIQEINKRLSEEEARIKQMRESLSKDLQSAVNGINSENADDLKRLQLTKQIDLLRTEAKQAILNNEPDSKISEINTKIEALLEEIKQLNP